MCTVIPADLSDPENTYLPVKVFEELVESISIVNRTKADAQVETLDVSKLAKSSNYYDDIYQQITGKSNATCFQITEKNASLYFVCCLQALMKHRINAGPEGPSVCLYLVDPEFVRPPRWSYRYFWRYIARTYFKAGMTIASVGQMAERTKKLCNVVF